MHLSLRRTLLIVTLAVLLVAIVFTPAQAAINEIAWKKFTRIEGELAESVNVDKNGNVIVASQTWGNDVSGIVRKWSGGGRVLWYKKFKFAGNATVVTDVTVDPNGFIYVIGSDIVNFESYLSKYGPKGGHHWIEKLHEAPAGIAADSKGNVYVVSWEVIRKYDADGDVIWTRLFKPENHHDSRSAIDVAVGPGGAIYVAAQYAPGAEEELGAVDILKYSPDGDILWTRRVHSRFQVWGRAIIVDRTGGVILLGMAGHGGAVASKVFVTKYTHKGRRKWTRAFRNHTPQDVTADTDGNIYVVGAKINDGKTYARKYSSNGDLRWTRYFFNKADANGAATDLDDNLYVAGMKYSVEFPSFLVKFRRSSNLCGSAQSYLCW